MLCEIFPCFPAKIAVKVSTNRLILKIKADQTKVGKKGDIAAMLGVLFGQGEVLVLIIITAVVVFLLVRGRRRQ